MRKERKPQKPRPAPSSDGGDRAWRKGHVVAVGASAGGIKAVGNLLSGLPANFAAPIVAVVHLDPSHLSNLAPLLQRGTRLKVHVAKAGMRLAPGTVYVAPPDHHLEVRGDRIRLTRAPRVHFSRPSIDKLFASVATTFGDRAIAVVLSGTGSDGSVGSATIKAAGGFVVAQDPKTAEFNAMPTNAVASGCVDVVARIEEIPAILVGALRPTESPELPTEWPLILSLVQKRFGTDFSGYRATTLRRRLDRRILATQQPDIKAYVSLLRRNSAEVERLHSEFLIKVSGFFRDSKEWARLESKVVGPLVHTTPASREIRIWSAGCATGEEAYSLAILFAEALQGSRDPGRFKVFATDIDDHALATARLGVYTRSQLSGVSATRLRRFFDQNGSRWRIKKELRKHVVFGKHDLVRDPPLAYIDLVACRNVLIYFTSEQSNLALQRLLYALRPDGFLFLGRSEGLHRAGTGLQRVRGSLRIFQRAGSVEHLVQRTVTTPSPRGTHPAAPVPVPATADQIAFRRLILGAANVIMFGVDSAQKIILWNKAAAAFFGVSSSNAMARPAAAVLGSGFWNLVVSVMEQGGHAGNAVREARLVHRPRHGRHRTLDLDWTRLDDGSGDGILFLGVATNEPLQGPARPGGGQPGDEPTLSTMAADEALQSANEELRMLNEALQSTSEEQQTLNEELESRNEELQTVNEELQSLNEELNTLNEEVGVRISEADRLSGFLHTILDLQSDAVIACDSGNRITFWNAPARKLFHLSQEQAVGKDLFRMVPVLDTPSVRKMTRAGRGKQLVRIRQGAGHPGELLVELGPVRDRAGRRQGYCLRIAEAPRRGRASGGQGPKATTPKRPRKN